MTSVLTDEEKRLLAFKYGITKDAVDDIGSILIRKLSAGVSVEPVEHQVLILGNRWAHCTPILFEKSHDRSIVRALYTAEAIAAARVQAIQDCDDAVSELSHDASRGDCGQAIRALLGKEAT